MATVHQEITPELQRWIEKQRLFFVATAPLSSDGHVNCSPKGLDSFRILGPRKVAYLDITGSGVETISHIRENGRIVFMFCAFEGAPKILRLHGKAEFNTPDSHTWNETIDLFPSYPGVRSIITADLTRICDSCGFAVPRYEFLENRDTLEKVWSKQEECAAETYQQEENLRSIDELPGVDPRQH